MTEIQYVTSNDKAFWYSLDKHLPGLGHAQLAEAVRRIKEYEGLKKIIVTTNELFIPAQRNYESVCFVKVAERENPDTPFSGKYIDYEIDLIAGQN